MLLVVLFINVTEILRSQCILGKVYCNLSLVSKQLLQDREIIRFSIFIIFFSYFLWKALNCTRRKYWQTHVSRWKEIRHTHFFSVNYCEYLRASSNLWSESLELALVICFNWTLIILRTVFIYDKQQRGIYDIAICFSHGGDVSQGEGGFETLWTMRRWNNRKVIIKNWFLSFPN